MKGVMSTEQKPRDSILVGLFFCLVSVGLYWYLWDFEQSTDTSRSIHRVIASLYNTGGKPLAAGPFMLLGLALLGKGVFDLVRPSSDA